MCLLPARAEYLKSAALMPKLLDTFLPLETPAESGAESQHAGHPSVHSCSRNQWVNPLKIRLAEVEDYDDLVKVFDSQTELRSQVYGEFFLAELIGGQSFFFRRAVSASLNCGNGLKPLGLSAPGQSVLEGYGWAEPGIC